MATLAGYVYNSSGNAISGATVRAYVHAENATVDASGSQITDTTDANGRWDIVTTTTQVDIKITFGDSVRWLKAGDDIMLSKLELHDTLTVGKNDLGYDVIFYGGTDSANMTWDASEDDLILSGAARIVVPEGQLVLGSAAVSSTAAELNLLDGVSGLVQADFTKLAAVDATADELDLLDGSAKSTSSITIADADAFIVIDGTTTKQIPASDIATYVAASVGDITQVTLTGDDTNTATDSAGSADFTIAGGSGLTTSVSGTTVTVAGDNASTSAKGVAQFSSDNFAASSGTITIKDGGIVTAELAADAVTGAKIADDAIDSDHLASNAVITASITDANVTLAKIANAAANTVIVRDANSSGVLSAKAVADTQLLIGDGTGFTAASLSGDVTMANDGAVTIASTAVEAGMLNNNVINGQSAEITSGLAAADELLYSDDGTLKKVGLDNFVELSPQLATEDAIAVASDYLLFLDGGATGNMNKESVADFVSAIAGTGLTASSGQLTASGGGINNAVIFRLTSDFTGDADPITASSSNLEQDDTHADSTLGDSAQVTVGTTGAADGVFTFPTDGHYLVQAHVLFGNGAADAETNLHIQVTVNNSDYNDATVAQGSVYNSSARTTIVAQTIVDVADKATDKVRFKISGNSSSNTVFGSTSINYTYFTFIRLADTDSTQNRRQTQWT